MPVENHPVHEKTKISTDWRYGCNNHKPRKGNTYWAPNRIYHDDGTYISVIEEVKTEWIDYKSCPAAHDHQGCIDCIHKPPPQKDCDGSQHHRYSGSFSE